MLLCGGSPPPGTPLVAGSNPAQAKHRQGSVNDYRMHPILMVKID
jgi:hypothetical protein